MDETKLEKLHNDFKKASETRGKHGGLGKQAGSSSSGAKRIQIEYVAKSAPPVPSSSVPNSKQPFIKFVPASDSKPPTPDVEVVDAPQNGEKKKVKKEEKKPEAYSTTTIIHIQPGKDILKALRTDATLSGVEEITILSAWGSVKKIVWESDDQVTTRNAQLISMHGDPHELYVKVVVTDEEFSSNYKIFQGPMKKCKSGDGGVQVLVGYVGSVVV